MPRRTFRLAAPAAVLTSADLVAKFDAIRASLGVPTDFEAAVLEEARDVVPVASDVDLTDLPFVTLDPPGSTDLDQAMNLSRTPTGFHVDYAIADVPAFVAPDGAIAAEAMKRAETIYAPDQRTPLHPAELSEGRASLLPDGDRPAFVWRFELSPAGDVTSFELVRAMVRSRAQYSYDSFPADLTALLQEIGELRLALEEARGGASLPLPEQEVAADGDGFTLRLRAARPIEDWNAQLSLMTGMAAAELMLKAGFGVLRTLPPPETSAMARFREQAKQLGVQWPPEKSYGAFLRRLDGGRPQELALLHAAGALFRGAAYTPFVSGGPDHTLHAAVAAPYAHVTAPLRRLVDRFGLVAAYSAYRSEPAPAWLLAGLPLLPAAMTAGDRRAGDVDRQCIDAVEVAVLAGRVGDVFAAVVVDDGHVQLLDPPVLARCGGSLTPGTSLQVRLTSGDPVRFEPTLDPGPAGTFAPT